MRISLNELVQEMESRGYKITHHGVKYYTQKGLLPKPIKQGGYGKGVHLVFPDKDDVLARLFKIFDMKGKGFKLSEIKATIRDEEQLKFEYRRKKLLETFIEKDDQFFLVLEEEPNEPWIESLEDIIKNTDAVDKYLYKTPFLEGDPNEVIRRKLHLPAHIYDDKPIYPDYAICEALDWIKLRRDYDIDWHTLMGLYKKHRESFYKYFFWPNPDGTRFTETYIGWRRQLELNYFGTLFKEYIERVIHKTLVYFDLKFDFFGEVPIAWDFQYNSVDILIQEFLEGKCAFVPSSDADIRYFLKSFKTKI